MKIYTNWTPTWNKKTYLEYKKYVFIYKQNLIAIKNLLVLTIEHCHEHDVLKII